MRMAAMITVVAKTGRMVRDISSIVIAMGVVFGALGTLAYPWTEPYFKIPQNMEDIARRLGQVELAVDELRPPIRVAIFDDVGSAVFASCGRHATCVGQYRVKRSDVGLSCGRPYITGAFVINHSGRRWAVSEFQVEPVRADDDWVTVPFTFTPPDNALDGPAQFFFSMEYKGCDFAATNVHVENTLRLPFMISSRNGKPPARPE